MTRILLLLTVLLPISGVDNETLAASLIEQPIIPVQSSTIDNAIDLSNFSTVDDLRALLATGFQQPDFLDVDQAFKLRLHATRENKIRAVFDIADGYYLYRDKIAFSNDGENRIARVDLPAGTVKEDDYFGEVAVFNRDFSFAVELSGRDDDLSNDLNNLIIHANYQGCAEDGICYAPVNKSFNITGLTVIPVAQADHQTTTGPTSKLNTEIFKDPAADLKVAAPESSDGGDQYTDQYTDMAVSLEAQLPLLLGALFAGILLTFTPCVLPMIPILSGVIAGQGNNLTKTKGGILAATYVLGTVVTYAGMGALAGTTGDQLQAYFQNIWAIGILSAVFFVMALSMFGLFEIRMPQFIQSKAQAKIKGMSGSIPLVFLLGLVSALIIGACVSPVMISFLGIAVATGDPLLGAQLMTVMAVGMGLPLIALGFGAGHFIPRAGKWMVKVKQGFGVMLIAVAIYLLGILPQVPVLLLWGGFFIIISLFLGAVEKPPKPASNWRRIEKGIGIILLVWGILLIAGGLFGQRDILRPLPPTLLRSISGATGLAEQNASHPFVRVRNNDELERQLARARAQRKPVLIDYYADWCVDCIRMEKTTFANPQVKAVLAKKFITVQIDVTDPRNSDSKKLKQRFGVFGAPATLFIGRDGASLSNLSFYGYMESDEFLSLITAL
ncbi:protein-disulfide reductase DsbD [Candidatus Spongiihabitans sp.]|uniref:protein-disulfide reductase DsbD n=1 Tax=Candidatus Spongiihabitans sp. TaxID=3101308 RepID=UPI003C7E005C